MGDLNQSLRQQRMVMRPNFFVCDQGQVPMVMEPSSSIGAFLEKEIQDLDCFVQQQINLLGANIQQQLMKHLTSIVINLDSKAIPIIRKKEEELALMTNRIPQLNACVKKMEQDRFAWEKLARENEALVLSLSNALNQIQSPSLSSTGSNSKGRDEELGDEMTASCLKNEKSQGFCKACGLRDSCMLMLPCRHVCTCLACDESLGVCPVCASVKESSVEVFLA